LERFLRLILWLDRSTEPEPLAGGIVINIYVVDDDDDPPMRDVTRQMRRIEQRDR
jgi:hypothetical protein